MKTRTALVSALVLAASLSAAGCGSSDTKVESPASDTPSPVSDENSAWSDGPWLLGFNTAGGSEGETVGAVYIRFTPSTGATELRKLPGQLSRDTYSDSQAVLVSADQRYVLLDSRVAKADRAKGRLTLYPIDADSTVKVDLRAWSSEDGLQPVGAAFDPVEGSILRVVDRTRAVWRVDLDAQTAVRDGELPSRPGWIFANGFDKNSGIPYIESIDSPETLPAGNGDDDVRPLTRHGGVILSSEGFEDPVGIPKPPCGFSGGFVAEDETYWLFCADTPQITAFRLVPDGTAWEQVGAPSAAVVPDTAEEIPVVLPPVATPGG